MISVSFPNSRWEKGVSLLSISQKHGIENDRSSPFFRSFLNEADGYFLRLPFCIQENLTCSLKSTFYIRATASSHDSSDKN